MLLSLLTLTPWVLALAVAASHALAGFAEGQTAYSAKDHASAYEVSGQAADQGHAAEQYHLGTIYRRGLGVPRNDAEAVRWYRKAAEQGHVKAQLWLGAMYGWGQGVEQDFTEAARWYRMAAERGDAIAQHNLGALYRKGQGVPQNLVEAYMWLSLFVAQQPDSQHAWILGDTELFMTQMEIVEAKERAKNWQPRSGK